MPRSIRGDCSIGVVKSHTAAVVTQLNLDGGHEKHVGGGKFLC